MPSERTVVLLPTEVGGRVFFRRHKEPPSEAILAEVRDLSKTSIRLSCPRIMVPGEVVLIQTDEFQKGRRPRATAVVARVRRDRTFGYELTCTLSPRPYAPQHRPND